MERNRQDARFLLQMAGPSGAGKSTLAHAIARRTGAVVLDLDIVKSAALDAGVAWDRSGRTAYQVIRELGGALLAQGQRVILDSPCRFAFIVEGGTAVAAEQGVPYLFIECVLPDEEELGRRLAGRAGLRSQPPELGRAPADAPGGNGASAAVHRTVYPGSPWLQVDMQAPVEENLARSLDYIAGQGVGVPYALFPAQSTVLEEDALLKYILPAYDVPDVEDCRFLERGGADIYRVRTAGGSYYLKIYRPPRSLARTEGEARFTGALAEAGLPVVEAVRLKAGGFASEVRVSEGLRPMLLFEEAPPALPAERTPELLGALGRLVAEVHQMADGLGDDFELPVVDPIVFLEEQVRTIRPYLESEDRAFLGEAAGALGAFMAEQPRTAPGFGLCHADLVLSNVRYSADNGVTLMDFGNAMHTWRGLELAVVYWGMRGEPEKRGPLWEAYLAGYAEVQPLPALVRSHLPALLMMRQVGFMGANCKHLPLRLGTYVLEDGFMQREMAALREFVSESNWGE